MPKFAYVHATFDCGLHPFFTISKEVNQRGVLVGTFVSSDGKSWQYAPEDTQTCKRYAQPSKAQINALSQSIH